MNVKCLFFAASKDATGVHEKALTIDKGTKTDALIQNLIEQFPALRPIFQSAVLAVNQEYIDPESPIELKEGDEIAVIPPISGG
jgi:molybdopterin converting factor subunit 1